MNINININEIQKQVESAIKAGKAEIEIRVEGSNYRFQLTKCGPGCYRACYSGKEVMAGWSTESYSQLAKDIAEMIGKLPKPKLSQTSNKLGSWHSTRKKEDNSRFKSR